MDLTVSETNKIVAVIMIFWVLFTKPLYQLFYYACSKCFYLFLLILLFKVGSNVVPYHASKMADQQRQERSIFLVSKFTCDSWLSISMTLLIVQFSLTKTFVMVATYKISITSLLLQFSVTKMEERLNTKVRD